MSAAYDNCVEALDAGRLVVCVPHAEDGEPCVSVISWDLDDTGLRFALHHASGVRLRFLLPFMIAARIQVERRTADGDRP